MAGIQRCVRFVDDVIDGAALVQVHVDPRPVEEIERELAERKAWSKLSKAALELNRQVQMVFVATSAATNIFVDNNGNNFAYCYECQTFLKSARNGVMTKELTEKRKAYFKKKGIVIAPRRRKVGQK